MFKIFTPLTSLDDRKILGTVNSQLGLAASRYGDISE